MTVDHHPYRRQHVELVDNDRNRLILREMDRVLQFVSDRIDDLPSSSVGIAPANAAYVTIGHTASLSAERALTGTANQITITDGGADAAVTLSTPQNLDTAALFQVANLGVNIAANASTARILVNSLGLHAGILIQAPISTAGPWMTFKDTDAGGTKIVQANQITGASSLFLPDGGGMSASDFLVSRTSLDTLTQKTLASPTVIRTGISSSGTRFQDGSVTTKQVFLDLTGATGNNQLVFSSTSARVWTVPNYTGTFAVPVDEGTSGTVLVSSGAGAQPAWTSLSSGGIAPNSAQYVTLALSAGLTAERVLTGTSNQITITDGGANGNVTLSTPQNLHTSATFQVSTLGLGAAARTSPATLALDVTGRTAFITVAQSFGTNQTNYDIGASTVLRLTATAAGLIISGFTNGVDGRVVFVINDGSTNSFALRHDSTATAANRFKVADANNCVISPGECKVCIYDGTASRWRVTNWMGPNGQYTISGAFTWNTTLTVDRDGGGDLNISGNMPGTPPRVLFTDSGTSNVITFQVPVADGNYAVDLPGSFVSRLQVCGDTAVTAGNAVAAGTLGKHDSTGNAGSIAATTLGKTVRAGMYRLDWYIKVTTAGDVIATDNLKITAAWNDGGAQTKDLQPMNEAAPVSPFAVDTLNKAYSGSCVVYSAASQDISFSTTLVNGGVTNPQYTCRVRLEAMS